LLQDYRRHEHGSRYIAINPVQQVTPVILAIQEAEVRGIPVQSQPSQRVHETPSRKNPTQGHEGKIKKRKCPTPNGTAEWLKW
jgi:hypothetical protein